MNEVTSHVITWQILALVLLIVGYSAIAQISLKYGMILPSVRRR